VHDVEVKIESKSAKQTIATRSASAEEDSIVSDDEEEIERGELPTPHILDESLHIRIIRQFNSRHHPTLAYQTFIRALQRYSTNHIGIFNHLHYKKLQDCATLYLGFDIKTELLAVDYGSKREPEWLFVQDDASLCSTVQTWRVRWPKVAGVDVLVVERPGFISYQSPSAVIAGVEDEGMDEDEDEDDGDDDDDDDDDESEDGEDEESAAEEDGDGNEDDEEMEEEDNGKYNEG